MSEEKALREISTDTYVEVHAMRQQIAGGNEHLFDCMKATDARVRELDKKLTRVLHLLGESKL